MQRPLEDIAERESSVFVPRGVDVPCLDQDKTWQFSPKNFRVGQVPDGMVFLGYGDREGDGKRDSDCDLGEPVSTICRCSCMATVCAVLGSI